MNVDLYQDEHVSDQEVIDLRIVNIIFDLDVVQELDLSVEVHCVFAVG